MSYQKIFPKILEKTYSSCKDVSTNNIPMVEISKMFYDKKFVSLPFLDTVNIGNLTKEDIASITKNQKIEIKLSEFSPHLKKMGGNLLKFKFKKFVAKGHIISELTTEEDFWKSFHKHTRNDIRKAEKSDLKIKKIDSIKELKKFYKLYFKQMKKFGTPQHSFKFFKNCFEMMGKDFFGLNCYRKNKMIGSIILFLHSNYAYVPFNISNNKFRNFRPNDLLYWEALKWCMKNKIKYFDIGQIDLSPEEGTRAGALLKFKRKWLGKEYKKLYLIRGFEYSQSKKDNLKKFRKIWSKLPNFIIKLIGPIICSRLG